MAAHAEDPLRRPGIAQVLNLPLAIATSEAACAESLVARKYSQVLDFVAASITAVGAIIADQRAIAKKEEVRVGVKQRAAGVASKAIDVPSVSGCVVSVS